MSKPENLIDTYLENRLQEWAEWLKTGNFLNIGYQRKSSIAMFAEGKTANKKGNNFRNIENNEPAEEMEKMVSKMAEYKPMMADCLRYHYLHQKSLRNSSKSLGISHVQYKMCLQMAKHWLIGKML